MVDTTTDIARYYNTHYTDEEIEAQRSEKTNPGSQSLYVAIQVKTLDWNFIF